MKGGIYVGKNNYINLHRIIPNSQNRKYVKKDSDDDIIIEINGVKDYGKRIRFLKTIDKKNVTEGITRTKNLPADCFRSGLCLKSAKFISWRPIKYIGIIQIT